MRERDLFIVALEIDDETARQAYLDEACVGDSALRVRVERLLNRESQAGDFLEQPAADLCSDMDAGLLAEASEPQPDGGDPPTILGKSDDTGQSVLMNPEVSAASITNPGVASTSQSGLTEPSYVFGTLFGRYRVERVLGSGGMGVVYLAEDSRLGRRVALKIPKFDVDGKFQLSERFRREARTMASVLHRNLCPIFDVDEQDGTHYLTMAFIDGKTLAEVLKIGSSFTTRQIAELIRKLALALDEAHRAGVIHRDLKPANVMIDHSGEPILMDFGLAWMAHETDSRVTQSGAIVGTPAYMAPEQAEGVAEKIGAASDIYSLGAILYELLASRPIHTGSVTRVLFKLMHEAPTLPSKIHGDVDRKLEEICLKAIARQPEDRFATAAEFAEALARFLEGRPWEGEAPAEPRTGERRAAERHGSAGASSSRHRDGNSDRTDLLPPDTSAETIAYQSSGEPVGVSPRTGANVRGLTPVGSPGSRGGSRDKSRVVLAGLLLIGVAWAIVDGLSKPNPEVLVSNGDGGRIAQPDKAQPANSPPDQSPPSPEPLKLELALQLPSVTRATGLKLGDLDGDGDLDLFVAMLKAPCVMLRNDGRGHFTDSGQQLGDNASFAVALGDLDRDGDLDAFVCNSDEQEDAIWLNDGRGMFQRSPQSFPLGMSNDVVLTDIDGDNDHDVVVSNWQGPATIWINDGSGHFTSQQTIARIGNTGVALGDLDGDGDGDADLVMTSFGGDNRVWFNDGQGHFSDSDQQIELAKSTSVALGDLDQDGNLDLFITAHQGNQIWFNDGSGRFQNSEQRFGDGLCEAVELVDLDADHDLDAISIGGGFEFAKPRSVWRNDGKGRFQKVATTLQSGRSQALAVGDLDGDGDADVIFGNLDEPAEVWLNPSNQSPIP